MKTQTLQGVLKLSAEDHVRLRSLLADGDRHLAANIGWVLDKVGPMLDEIEGLRAALLQVTGTAQPAWRVMPVGNDTPLGSDFSVVPNTVLDVVERAVKP